jgi:hypothetical protein
MSIQQRVTVCFFLRRQRMALKRHGRLIPLVDARTGVTSTIAASFRIQRLVTLYYLVTHASRTFALELGLDFTFLWQPLVWRTFAVRFSDLHFCSAPQSLLTAAAFEAITSLTVATGRVTLGSINLGGCK